MKWSVTVIEGLLEEVMVMLEFDQDRGWPREFGACDRGWRQ